VRRKSSEQGDWPVPGIPARRAPTDRIWPPTHRPADEMTNGRSRALRSQRRCGSHVATPFSTRSALGVPVGHASAVQMCGGASVPRNVIGNGFSTSCSPQASAWPATELRPHPEWTTRRITAVVQRTEQQLPPMHRRNEFTPHSCKGVGVRIARQGIESGERRGRRGWVIERTISWRSDYRGLSPRYERHSRNTWPSSASPQPRAATSDSSATPHRHRLILQSEIVS